MTSQKRRKTMDDSLAEAFVFGQTGDVQEAQRPQAQTEPEGTSTSKSKDHPTSDSIMSKLLEPTQQQERTIRFTADLPESLHRKLTMLAARTGRKKIDIVRDVLDEVLKDVEV